jgi:hypothetical protein
VPEHYDSGYQDYMTTIHHGRENLLMQKIQPILGKYYNGIYYLSPDYPKSGLNRTSGSKSEKFPALGK